MPSSYFPLRWESTGDQWWYAAPIDFAAANGQYDLVRELLHIDPNLLIKLTSLRRIWRLETVWDDEEHFKDVAKCRSLVAKKLLIHCETQGGHKRNSLIRAGYGGWLLYTAASAGDVGFVRELLRRDPLMVFGEGEYGVTDILYAAARSKDCEVFRILLDSCMCPRCGEVEGVVDGQQKKEPRNDFRWEMMKRAVHAAARGGNLVMLKELLGDCCDVLAYRDAQGSSLLHAASGRGQVEVVKYLVTSFDMIKAADYQGNTALHVAAYRGHLAVAEVLMLSSPNLIPLTDNYGDTFLHLAVSGFRTPGFRRVDKQIELIKHIVSSKIVNVEDIINCRNNDGRTALHIAVIENVQSNVVKLLMNVRNIDLNIRDANEMTPLDLLKQRPKSASSEILIRQLISGGGISHSYSDKARIAIVSQLRVHGIGMSPGTSFRVPDSEIFLYTGMENVSDVSREITNVDYRECSGEISDSGTSNASGHIKPGSAKSSARRLKNFLRWPKKKEKKAAATELEKDDDTLDSLSLSRSFEECPTPLRQRYSKMASFSSNNGKLSASGRIGLPSPLTRKKFTLELMQGVIQTKPSAESSATASPFSQSSVCSPASLDYKSATHTRQSLKHEQDSFNKKMMNHYFCFGAQDLAVEDSIKHSQQNQSFKNAPPLVA